MTNTDDAKINLARLHQALGIPSDYAESCKLPLCIEPATLVNTELDFYQRRAATHARGIPGLVAYARGSIGAGNLAVPYFGLSWLPISTRLDRKEARTGADYCRNSACERRPRLQRAPQR